MSAVDAVDAVDTLNALNAGAAVTVSGLHQVLSEPTGVAPSGLTLMLGHALGCDGRMWDALTTRLLARGHRVLRYDQRGHGRSAPVSGPVTIAGLADEAAALVEQLGVGPVVWVGLSMGGMVGQELALRHPEAVRALVLANTTSGYPAEAREGWTQRIAAIREGGLEAIVDGALQRWFTADFRAAHPEVVALWRERVLQCDPASYVACCEAIRDVGTTSRLSAIDVPTLVIGGAMDVGTPPAMAERIAREIPDARLVLLLEASHLSVLEQPAAFGDALDAWLSRLPRP